MSVTGINSQHNLTYFRLMMQEVQKQGFQSLLIYPVDPVEIGITY